MNIKTESIYKSYKNAKEQGSGREVLYLVIKV